MLSAAGNEETSNKKSGLWEPSKLSLKYIGAIGGPVPDVDEMFEPYDGSGNLYYRNPPQDY